MTNRLTDEELEELERLEQDATPGPWVFRDDSCGEYRVLGPDCKLVFNKDFGGLRRHLMPPHEEDARLFVAARNALPSLLAEVRELRAIVAQIDDEDLRVLQAMARGVPAVAAPAEHVQISGKVKA